MGAGASKVLCKAVRPADFCGIMYCAISTEQRKREDFNDFFMRDKHCIYQKNVVNSA